MSLVEKAVRGLRLYLALILLLFQSSLPISLIILNVFLAAARFIFHPLSPEENMNLLMRVISKPSAPLLVPYVPQDEPPPTIFEVKLHPDWKRVCDQLDDYFVKHWPAFKTPGKKAAFLASDTNKWACWALPYANNDRLYDSVRVNTLLFLLDDIAEEMTLKDGKDFYRRLIPIAMGKILPNRDDPYEWITYDTWEALRNTDQVLADQVLQQAFVCILAQVDEARLSCTDMGALLRQRTKEAGIAYVPDPFFALHGETLTTVAQNSFVAAVMRYGMNLHLSNVELDSIPGIDDTYAKHGVTVNDILSFDKELKAHHRNPSEGSSILNMVNMLAQDTGISYEAAKRVLWILCREWEIEHQRMVQDRMTDKKLGCSADLRAYLKGMEWVLGGNEYWSSYTKRYKGTT